LQQVPLEPPPLADGERERVTQDDPGAVGQRDPLPGQEQVPHRHDPHDPVVLRHDQVADPPVGHLGRRLVHLPVRADGDHVAGHDFFRRRGVQVRVGRDRVQHVPFGEDAREPLPHQDQGRADLMAGHGPGRLPDRLAGRDRHDVAGGQVPDLHETLI
jgi:hypothetical protein